MALAFTNVVSNALGSLGGATTFSTSDTITPVAGDLFVVDITIYIGSISQNGTLTGAGLSWTAATASPLLGFGNAGRAQMRFYGVGAGSTGTLTWTRGGSDTAGVVAVQVTRVTGALTSGPIAQTATNPDQNTATPSVNITVVDAANGLLAAAATYGTSPTWTAGTGYTELAETSNSGNDTLAVQYRTTTDTNADGTWSALEVTTMLVSEIVPAPAGPTIDTQPTAVTRVLTNANTATFTVAATTSGGSLTYDWELETSVGGGVYANLADGSGATWTGQASATCTATLTAKTLSGRRVRCNVTDDNGTTTSSAVALTIFDGPQVTTFGPTDGSGVSTATLTCDYVTGVGEAIEVAIILPGGRLAVSVTTT